MHAFIGTPCWNWCFANRIVLSTVAMFCYYLLLGVCILNMLSESVNFKHWNSCWKVEGELWFNKVSRGMRFNSQSVVVVSSFNHHCLCHCWFWTTTQLLGLCSEKKKSNVALLTRRVTWHGKKTTPSDLMQNQKGSGFPIPWLERAFWSTKKKHHIQANRDLKRLKTHDFDLPPPRKMKPHQVLPKKHSMKVQSEFRRSIILIVTQMDWLAFVKSTTKFKTPQLSAEL